MRRRFAPVLAACALTIVAWPGVAAGQSWEDLEARQAILAGIEIVVTDAFDVAGLFLSKSEERVNAGRAPGR